MVLTTTESSLGCQPRSELSLAASPDCPVTKRRKRRIGAESACVLFCSFVSYGHVLCSCHRLEWHPARSVCHAQPGGRHGAAIAHSSSHSSPCTRDTFEAAKNTSRRCPLSRPLSRHVSRHLSVTYPSPIPSPIRHLSVTYPSPICHLSVTYPSPIRHLSLRNSWNSGES